MVGGGGRYFSGLSNRIVRNIFSHWSQSSMMDYEITSLAQGLEIYIYIYILAY